MAQPVNYNSQFQELGFLIPKNENFGDFLRTAEGNSAVYQQISNQQQDQVLQTQRDAREQQELEMRRQEMAQRMELQRALFPLQVEAQRAQISALSNNTNRSMFELGQQQDAAQREMTQRTGIAAALNTQPGQPLPFDPSKPPEYNMGVQKGAQLKTLDGQKDVFAIVETNSAINDGNEWQEAHVRFGYPGDYQTWKNEPVDTKLMYRKRSQDTQLQGLLGSAQLNQPMLDQDSKPTDRTYQQEIDAVLADDNSYVKHGDRTSPLTPEAFAKVQGITTRAKEDRAMGQKVVTAKIAAASRENSAQTGADAKKYVADKNAENREKLLNQKQEFEERMKQYDAKTRKDLETYKQDFRKTRDIQRLHTSVLNALMRSPLYAANPKAAEQEALSEAGRIAELADAEDKESGSQKPAGSTASSPDASIPGLNAADVSSWLK